MTEAVKDPEPEKNPSDSKEQNEPTTTREVPQSHSFEFSKPREPPVLHYLGASGDTDNNFVVFDKSDASNTRWVQMKPPIYAQTQIWPLKDA